MLKKSKDLYWKEKFSVFYLSFFYVKFIVNSLIYQYTKTVHLYLQTVISFFKSKNWNFQDINIDVFCPQGDNVSRLILGQWRARLFHNKPKRNWWWCRLKSRLAWRFRCKRENRGRKTRGKLERRKWRQGRVWEVAWDGASRLWTCCWEEDI